MKVKAGSYVHKENGFFVQLIPETDVEEEILRALYRHGEMRLGHPMDERGSTGFYITAFRQASGEQPGDRDERACKEDV